MLVHLLQERFKDQNLLQHVSIFPRTAVYTIAIFSILALGSFGGREFIYFQF